MSSPVKSYFLAPNFNFPPPPDGLIALGSILVDPKKPERSLNKKKQVVIDPSHIYNTYTDNWAESQKQRHEVGSSIWANFLQTIVGAGGDVEISGSHNVKRVYKCRRLETQYFQPNDSYIYESLQNPTVKSYIEKGWFKKPVYMITGLKLARGLASEASEGGEHGFEGGVGVDGTLTGVPVSGGPKARWKSSTDEDLSFTGTSDCVFAFQLIEIRSRKNQTPTNNDFNKGALYDADDDTEEDSTAEGLHSAWEITALENPDSELPGVVVSPAVDKNGDICNVMSDSSIIL